MRHLAPLLVLALFAAHTVSAAPRYPGDAAMIVDPGGWPQRADSPGVSSRIIRASYPAGPDVVPVPVPEPCSAVLLPLGSAAVVWARRRRPDSRKAGAGGVGQPAR